MLDVLNVPDLVPILQHGAVVLSHLWRLGLLLVVIQVVFEPFGLEIRITIGSLILGYQKRPNNGLFDTRLSKETLF